MTQNLTRMFFLSFSSLFTLIPLLQQPQPLPSSASDTTIAIATMPTLTDVPFTDLEIIAQCKNYRDAKLGGPTTQRFVVLEQHGVPTQYAVKMGGVFELPLQHELDWMNHLNAQHTSSKVTFPTGYGIVDDGDEYSLLVMQNIPGRTMWEEMREGRDPLSDADADDIAAVVQELRANTALCDNLPSPNVLTPSGSWYAQGHMFPPFNEGGRVLADRQDYHAFMLARLKSAFGFHKDDPNDGVEYDAARSAVLPTLGERVFTHGDLSPHNIKRLPDGRLGIFGFGMSFFGPGWAEPYAVLIAGEDEKYAKPLREAFARRGMDVCADLKDELWEFRRWHFVFGCTFSLAERGQS
ncbi:hypothetical protein BJ138DRAFT_72075 [Hygrophoropsis aurantiaca]|uniref:Uncharacterized protein n=1 Tax=Hygrophoropsis aurantiaca TaxID=72124 RepID=A0ACB8ABZ6_9AGAM|nr:hypothetical protein BJ138DRAFT_72075 [Hygrophoropsis aurantiaca]